MCESSVWVRYGDGRSEKVAEDILIARQEGDWVVLRGLMKEPQCIRAMIYEADSLKHTITLVSPDSSADSPAAHSEGENEEDRTAGKREKTASHEHRH